MPGGPELIIILVVVLVLFGGSQLPKLARNLGKAQKEFKDGMTDAERAEVAKPSDASTTASTSSTDGTRSTSSTDGTR